MPTLNESTLKQHIVLNPDQRAFFLVGNDPFLIEVCLRIIKNALDTLPAAVFNAEKPDRDKLSELFFNVSLEPRPRLIVVENAQPSKMTEDSRAFFGELFRAIPQGLVVALVALYEDERFSVPKKTLELLPPSAAVCALEKKQGGELRSLIRALAKNAGASIDDDAVELLVSLCGNDLMRIKNEIGKTAAFSAYTTITADAVGAVVADAVETGVFELVRALTAGDRAAAAEKLSEMLLARREPISICAVLINSYTGVYTAKLARDAGLSMADYYERFGFQKNDKKPKISYDRSRSYTHERLCRIIRILYKLDGDLKSSRADHSLELETAVIEIMNLE